MPRVRWKNLFPKPDLMGVFPHNPIIDTDRKGSMSSGTSHQSQESTGRRREILVIRFGSLGDLCLLGWTLARLADRPGAADRRVTLVTKSAFVPLMSRFRGIHEVVPLEGSGTGALRQLAAELRNRHWDDIIDAHNILRGHLLLGMMRRRADRRLAKDTVARLAFMNLGRRNDRLGRTMHDRFGDLCTGLAPEADNAAETRPPLSTLAEPTAGQIGEDILGIAPGAQWETKRWPEEHFASLLEMWLQERTSRVRIFLGPREEPWFGNGPLNRMASESDRVEIIRDCSLTEVAARLSECHLLVTNDSGLLHVAEAVGTPVTAFFGPTVREFGYFPVLPGSRVLERSLDCRPCSRNGKRPCHRKDLACLKDISPQEAFGILTAQEDRP